MTDSRLSAGFTLIEVLVSMMLLSFGIIGTVKMQLVSLQASRQSHFYSTALELSTDMAEKMRSYSHQQRLAGLDLDLPSDSDSDPFLNIDFQSDKANSRSSVNCFTDICSKDRLAMADISAWLQRLDATLPNARAVICRDSAPWNNDTHSLVWDCASSDNASIIIKIGWADHNDGNSPPPPKLAIAVAVASQ